MVPKRKGTKSCPTDWALSYPMEGELDKRTASVVCLDDIATVTASVVCLDDIATVTASIVCLDDIATVTASVLHPDIAAMRPG